MTPPYIVTPPVSCVVRAGSSALVQHDRTKYLAYIPVSYVVRTGLAKRAEIARSLDRGEQHCGPLRELARRLQCIEGTTTEDDDTLSGGVFSRFFRTAAYSIAPQLAYGVIGRVRSFEPGRIASQRFISMGLGSKTSPWLHFCCQVQ